MSNYNKLLLQLNRWTYYQYTVTYFTESICFSNRSGEVSAVLGIDLRISWQKFRIAAAITDVTQKQCTLEILQ